MWFFIFVFILVLIVAGIGMHTDQKEKDEERRIQDEARRAKDEEERSRKQALAEARRAKKEEEERKKQALAEARRAKKEEERRRKQEEYEKNLRKMKQIVGKFANKLSREIENQYLNHSKYLSLHKEALSVYKQTEAFHKDLRNQYHIFFSFCEDKKFSKNHNETFIEDEKELYRDYFIKLDKHWFGLTEKQLEAVFCNEDATLVNAGAGTGKTKTIESKILYLHNKKWVSLDDILVITYSKKSQEDMMKRICDSLDKAKVKYDKDTLRYSISTFHAFGKRVLDDYFSSQNQVEDEDKTIGKGFAGKQVIDEKEQDEILALVLDRIKKNSLTQKILGDYLLYYSSPELAVSDFNTLNEYYENTKRSYTTLIKNTMWYNVAVKSYGEMMIANFCVSHGIKVEYEPRDHYYTDERGNRRSYKPDFYLPDYQIYIEYFGIDKRWKTADYIATDEYLTRMQQKIKAHEVSENVLIDLRYADFQQWKDIFLKKLETTLKRNGVKFNENISPEEILSIKELTWPFIWLAKVLKTFLSLYKESSSTLSQLKMKCLSFDLLNTTRNLLFLDIFENYLDGYTALLEEWKYIDFGDMIVEAQNLLENKAVSRNYKYILVDEFQDISEARAKLIQNLIQDTRLFCVGDDRQSIYKFAGSNTNIFLHFNKYFGYTEKITLDKTFRFNQGISDVSGAFIMMNPDQTKKNLISNDKELNGRISIFQQDEGVGVYNETMNSLLYDFVSTIKKWKKSALEIELLYLTRYSPRKYLKDYPQNFLSYLSEQFNLSKADKDWYSKAELLYGEYNIALKVRPLTIHKSKWLEADYVVVDYVNQNDRYNFPSSFDDDPILWLVIEDEKKGYPFSEERRLFYVGITRGKNKAFLIYNKNKESLFLKDLLSLGKKTVNLIANTSGDVMTLLSTSNAPKCPQCEGKLVSSQFDSAFSEYYCSNYRMGCETRYFEFDWFLHKAPNCPESDCKLTMKLRKNSKTGEAFWWCSSYPACTGTKIF